MAFADTRSTDQTLGAFTANTVRGDVLETPQRKSVLDGNDAVAFADKAVGALTRRRTRWREGGAQQPAVNDSKCAKAGTDRSVQAAAGEFYRLERLTADVCLRQSGGENVYRNARKEAQRLWSN
ncbi:MAG: hypothetical protein IPL86_17500 [Flavobacteriales bacterium]|nr:hypothetical protein [Flavobacteriales bacterium]